MPIMDGFQATVAIRQQEQFSAQHIPIVALTANAVSGDRERCLACGMDDYLSKPFTQEQLGNLLAKEEIQTYLAALRARYKVEVNKAALEDTRER